jgi:RHS repeat-associated protein
MVKLKSSKYYKSTNFACGRINKTSAGYDINYFITDHLGSTRVIVDNAGNIKGQYNYYPFGKQWEDINLMANTNRYTFSGKEKQTVKDLGYLDFGARMLETEFGRWFVIDPLAEKYYSVSPYVYCMNNPILFIDPDGMDIWEVNKQGQVKWIEESKTHVLYALDNKGKRTENSITVNDRSILDQLTTDRNLQFNYAEIGKEGANDVFNIFKFAADNTNVEWVVHKYENDGTKYTIGTKHQEATSGSSQDYGIAKEPIATIHSHPNVHTEMKYEEESMGVNRRNPNQITIWRDSDWYNVQKDVVSNDRQTRLNYVYFPNSKRLYHVNFSGSAFIRNIKNYKQFFFGTLK